MSQQLNLGFTPRITRTSNGRILASYGNTECWLAEFQRDGDALTVISNVRVSREHVPGLVQSFAGHWYRPDTLMFWTVTRDDLPSKDSTRSTLNVVTGERTSVGPSSDIGGNVCDARDGSFCEWKAVAPFHVRINGFVVALNAGPAITADGSICWTENDNGTLIVNGTQHTPTVPPTNRIIGPGGFVVYEGGGRLASIPDLDPQVAFWGEGIGHLWKSDGDLWLATFSFHDPSQTGAVHLRPPGDLTAINIPDMAVTHVSVCEDETHFIVVGSDPQGRCFASAVRKDTPRSIPIEPPALPVVVPEPHQPTIPVSVTVTGPRWVIPYYGGRMTDSQMPPAELWDADPVETPGHAHCLFHPYGGDDEKAFELVNGVRTQVRFWGWDWYLAHGGTRPVVATQWGAEAVPDGMLLGIYNGVESGDELTPKQALDIANARAMAKARLVPCYLYLDQSAHRPEVQARILALPPEAVGEEVILIVRLYPETYDLALDEPLWRAALRFASTAFRTPARVAISRKMYVRVDDTIAYVEAAQPVQTALANEFRVVADMPFSGWRESGVYRPVTGQPSNRLVLEPVLLALVEAATYEHEADGTRRLKNGEPIQRPTPPTFRPPPAPVIPPVVVKPKPPKVSFWAALAKLLRRLRP